MQMLPTRVWFLQGYPIFTHIILIYKTEVIVAYLMREMVFYRSCYFT